MSGGGFLKGCVIAGLLSCVASPALADQIDGDWCSTTEVAHFTIDGPNIITPAGTATTGDYRRHFFTCVVPAGDPGAGAKIDMQQLNHEEIDCKRSSVRPGRGALTQTHVHRPRLALPLDRQLDGVAGVALG